jgi:RNA polymerase sigma-70 factor (ECF subfamily)
MDEQTITDYTTDEINGNMHQMDPAEQQKVLAKALSKLPEEDSLLITLFYKAENSVEDISKITGLSVSNVKVKLFRIRKRLYEEMNSMMKTN